MGRWAGVIIFCEHQAKSGEAEGLQSADLLQKAGARVGVNMSSCVHPVRSGRSRNSASNYTLVFCVWLCGDTTWKRQARSGKLKLCIL